MNIVRDKMSFDTSSNNTAHCEIEPNIVLTENPQTKGVRLLVW